MRKLTACPRVPARFPATAPFFATALFFFAALFLIPAFPVRAQAQSYAERLGWPRDAKVLILHVDDAGMSYSSNQGTVAALEQGVATSCSVMMPCPWVPGMVRYIRDHPGTDAGLHLTLTSEWKDYRWVPLAGKPAVPGLTDGEGCLWPSVSQVAGHASPEEVYREIKAQLERALSMGFRPTHLDSHMGTLFATPEFLGEYIRLGVENEIPVMFPGGHNAFLREDMGRELAEDLEKKGQWDPSMPLPEPEVLKGAPALGRRIWDAGLPVLDDLHNVSYGWKMPDSVARDDKSIQAWYTDRYIETIGELKPGLTMVIMHCTHPSEVFRYISDSGPKRKGDLLAMQDPRLKAYLEKEEVILTTWREVMERRKRLTE